MSANSDIEWTDATWNPVRGCVEISPGCAKCYAKVFAERWRGVKGHAYEQGFDLRLAPDMLDAPMHWKKPKRIFVNSMSDLFHKDVPNEYIAAVFGVMASCPQHTFQVLTKRADRMEEWFKWVADNPFGVSPKISDGMGRYLDCDCEMEDEDMCLHMKAMQEVCEQDNGGNDDDADWPIRNVWVGVSCENRKHGLPRLEHLRRCPAAVRFVSFEPLLEDLGDFDTSGIDWAIVGAESGHGNRPMDDDWVRRIRDLCAKSGTAMFFKQRATPSGKKLTLPILDGVQHASYPETA